MIVHFYMDKVTNCGMRLRPIELQPLETGTVDLFGRVSHIAYFMALHKPGTRVSASNRIIEVTCKRCKKERKVAQL